MTDSPEVLVIDDNVENLEILTDILAKADYRVAAVRSGERALKRLTKYLPDLILLDIKMPGIDGLETCRLIKERSETAHIPIIFITALTDVDNIATCFSLGAVDYINKPIQSIELLSRVNNHLELQRLRQSLEQEVIQRTHDLEMALEYLKETLVHLQTAYLKMLQSEKMATHDPLTELPNRRLLMDLLERAIAKANYQGQTFALIFLDLDDFNPNFSPALIQVSKSGSH